MRRSPQQASGGLGRLRRARPSWDRVPARERATLQPRAAEDRPQRPQGQPRTAHIGSESCPGPTAEAPEAAQDRPQRSHERPRTGHRGPMSGRGPPTEAAGQPRTAHRDRAQRSAHHLTEQRPQGPHTKARLSVDKLVTTGTEHRGPFIIRQ